MKIFFLAVTFLWALEFKIQKLSFDNGVTLEVEVADDAEKRAQGLMNRTELAEGRGMLFIFESPMTLNFWNQNTFVELNIAYLDSDGVIQEIYDMKSQNMMELKRETTSYPSRCYCQFALEVPRGWFQKNKIRVGSKLRIRPKS